MGADDTPRRNYDPPPMGALERLAAAELRSVAGVYRDALRLHQDRINRLNVYPVPDGDTGTNMALTLESVCEELAEVTEVEMGTICGALSHGSLMGARGNSGVILSQVLRGLTEVWREVEAVDAGAIAAGLTNAAKAAYAAVMRPVEGTILTVVREAADAAEAAEAVETRASVLGVVAASRAAAQDALDRTPELLPVLAEAGVIDAGGAGFLLFLDALLHVIDGRPLPEPEVVVGVGVSPARATEGTGLDEDASDQRFEVMYFLEASDEAISGFRDVWAGIGDSIVVVGGDGLWNCHIHTNDVGAAIEAAVDCGRPRKIRVTDLHEQVEEERWVREATAAGTIDEEPPHTREPVPTAVVAVGTGEGIRRIFYSLGVQRIVAGGQSMNPSTAQILAAVDAAPADEVVVLPNNKNIVPVAEQVDGLTVKTVRVVPTASITEGFAALLAYDPRASADDNAEGMVDAAAAVVTGEITRAVRDAESDVGSIDEGDYIGVSRKGIRAVATDLGDAAIELLDALVTDEHEMVTIIEGEGSSPDVTRRITEWVGEHHPDVETEVHHGGQPLYPYLFGIE